VRLAVGESAEVGDYTLTYARLTADPRNERISFAARLDVTRDGKRFATLNPARNYDPTQDPNAGAIGRYFMGESTSEIGLKPEAGGDLWTAFQPDLSVLNPDIIRGNRDLANVGPDAQGIAIIALANNYAANPPPANFRVIVNPLVSWIWIGALIALAGALFAAWPALEARRQLEAAYRARLGRELGRLRRPASAGRRLPAPLSLACPRRGGPPRHRNRRSWRGSSRPASPPRRAGRGRPTRCRACRPGGAQAAKYREIRDAEADRAAGKLTEEDFRRLTVSCARKRSRS
jgi:hypothetical protein